MEKEVKTKKCSNCSRAPQSVEEFVNAKGRECSTCSKCREKAKRSDKKPERREYHNQLQKEKEYYKDWREKQLQERLMNIVNTITKLQKNGKGKILHMLQTGLERM